MHNSETGGSPHGSGFGSDRTTRVVKVLPISHNNATMFPSSSDASRKNMSWMPWLERAVPSLKWMKEYKWRDSLKADAIAGITVGTMLIPQVSQLLMLTSFASISTDNFDNCDALRRLRRVLGSELMRSKNYKRPKWRFSLSCRTVLTIEPRIVSTFWHIIQS